MQLRFMRFVVLSTCHILIPLTLAAVGFYVAALITHHLIASAVCAGLAGLAAFFSASRYALVAIGPRFVDRDFPPTWKFLGQRMLKLFLVLLIAPATVFVAYLVSMWFTPFCVIIAILAGLPGQFAASLVLAADADVWFWRIRRGRPIQSAKDILKRIARYARTAGAMLDQYVPWAGMMVPADLMAPHTKLFGMTKSGKTVTIRLMLQHLVERATPASNVKIIVFDPKRELFSYILGTAPMIPVLLCDATDRRGFAWDMGADITEPNHAKAVAKLFVPDEKSTQPYFARAGRRILEWVIRHLIKHASHWNLQDVIMILEDLTVLQQIIPPSIVRKYFKPDDTLKNTQSTLDTLTSRFETVAACWAHAEKAGRTISLTQFEALSTSAILVSPRRLEVADAVDPTIRLIFERLIHLWLARPDIRFLPPDSRPETYVILDETAKAGSLARLDDLLLMGRAKGVSVTIAAQDVEAMRQEYGEKIADSILAQCGNTAVFALESPATRDYCSSLFGTHEVRERPRTFQVNNMRTAIRMNPKDLYHPGELREHKTVLPSEFAQVPWASQTDMISGFFITAGLGAHYASYPFADLLMPPAKVAVLDPRDASDQVFPDALTPADLQRLGVSKANWQTPRKHPRTKSSKTYDASGDSLRFVRPITGK